MDVGWGSEITESFANMVALISSKGKFGYDIMACEWAMHCSFSPGLFIISVGNTRLTNENISKSKEFGISIAAFDQNVLVNVAGGNPGKYVDKISALKELGFSFKKAVKIDVMLPNGVSSSIECKLIKKVKSGDHTLFIGEVVNASSSGKEPLLYHSGKFCRIGEDVQKPDEKRKAEIKKIVEKYRKSSA